MRINLLLAGLLAGGVTALPKAVTPSSSTPLPTETRDVFIQPVNGAHSDDGDDDNNNSSSSTQLPMACNLPFGDAEEGKDAWKSSGAGDFLADYLEDHGVEGWANDFLKDTVKGGLNGPTFDCSNIQEISSCSLPQERSCGTYDPAEAYFVHISIANLNSLFHTLYLTLIDQELDDFVSRATDIEDEFGNPDTEGLFPMLIGSFVLGAAATGPFWVLGAPMTAMVAVLNLAAGVVESQGDVTESLEKTIEITYTRFRDSLEATAEAITSGDFDDLEGVDDTTEFILDAFGDGEMMVVDQKNLSVDKYLDSFSKFLVSSRFLPAQA